MYEVGETSSGSPTDYLMAKHALGLLVETIEAGTDSLAETDPAKLREIGDTATRLNYLLSCAEEATAQQTTFPTIQLVEQVEPEQVEVVVDTDSPSESGMKFAHSCLGEDFDYEGMSIHDIALEIYKRAGSPKPRLRQNGSTMTDPIERLTMRLQGMSIGQIAEHTESTKTTVDSWFYQQIMKNIKTKQEKEQAARKPPVRLRDTLQQTPLKIEKDSTQPHDIITNRLGSLGILDANELSAFHALVNPRKRTEVTNETINTTRKLKNIMQDELGPWKELLGKLTPFQQLRIRRLMGIAVTKAGRVHDATIFPLSHDVARVRAEGGDDIHIIKNSLLGINTLIRMLEEAGTVKETA